MLFSRLLRELKKPMKNIYLSLFSLFMATISFAQTEDHNHENHNWCGKNYATNKYFELNPEAKQQAIQDSITLNNAARSFEQQKDGPYIVPVVFHVVHANGDENISTEQIHSAIDELNKDFNAENTDLSSTIAQFEDIIGDVGIEFRLAKKDPDGNCTNGINRVYNNETVNAAENVKTGEASTWGRSSYLNIWVVHSIEGGTAAYAYLPSGAPTAGDGILIEHDHVGSIGTSQLYHRHTLSHEAGHWLNLEHTWGWSNTPGTASNCNIDDGVADTPNTRGRQAYGENCNLSEETCGSLDNVQNMMDYGWCSTMFTEDQKNRMLAAIESGVANREDLWSEQNLEETGVLDADVICFADFTSDSDPIICPGGEVEFIDLSFNGVTERQWIFEGGIPSTSSSNSPLVIYDEPGTYEVTLTASNDNGSMSVTKTDFVTVLPLAENAIPFVEDFESFSSLEPNDENWFVINTDGSDVKWQLTDDAAVSGSNSIFVNGRDNSFSYESTETLLSPTYDLSDVTEDENAFVTFKYAHVQRTGSSDDRLRVFISKDCGDTWSLRETLDIDELPTVEGTQSSYFIPSGEDDWNEVVIDNVSSVFQNESFRIRFDFRSFRGNNLYIDDINIFDPATLGLENVDFVEKFRIFPNPSNGIANLDYTLANSGRVAIDILDMSGRVIHQEVNAYQPSGRQIIQIETQTFQSGVYLVRLQSEDGQQVVKKLVKQ